MFTHRAIAFGPRVGQLIEKAWKKRIVPTGALRFDRERALGGVASGEVEGAAA